jgi:acetyltransferase-like isoleucine patch superfamily enzyme
MHRRQIRRLFVALLVAIMPFAAFRRFLYSTLLKYDIDRTAKIAPFVIILARKVTIRGGKIGMFNWLVLDELIMQEGALIRRMNRVQNIRKLQLSEGAVILNSNFIGGTWGSTEQTGRENFELGARSQITIGAFVDLTDTISFGLDVVAGGVGTQFWTHGFDCYRNHVSGPICVADSVFLGAACIVMPNVSICSSVTVGSGTVVHRSISEPGLYVSAQLVRKA